MSSSSLPMGLAAEAALGLSSLLAGVGPKKMQKALPGGQKASSPTSMTSLAVSSAAPLIPQLP